MRQPEQLLSHPEAARAIVYCLSRPVIETRLDIKQARNNLWEVCHKATVTVCLPDSYKETDIRASSDADSLDLGLVAKASSSGAEDPGFESRLRRDFSGSSHTSDLKIGTPVATMAGAWHYRVSAGTGRPGVSILWLGEVESLNCNFYLNVAARTAVWADSSLRFTRMLLGL